MNESAAGQPAFRFARAVCLAIVGILLGACATGSDVRIQMLSTQTFPETNVVQVLSALPARPYVELARMDVQGQPGESPAQLLAAIQAKAAMLGADAVVVREGGRTLPPKVEYNPSGGQYSASPSQYLAAYSAIAIHFVPVTPTSSPSITTPTPRTP